MEAVFVTSAADARGFPPEGLPEVAFLGRSNVGKSSLLNALMGRKLAFTSNTPGRTQVINFFRVDGRLHFVDLPGYGYAQVPRDRMQEWKRLIEAYLAGRGSLGLCLLLIDARRGWMQKDRELQEWLEHQGLPYLVVATKVDKLNRSELEKGMAALRLSGADPEPLAFSAVTGQGVRAIWQAISKTQGNRLTKAR